MSHSDCGERVSVQVKLWDPSRPCAIPERFWAGVHVEALYQVYVPLPSVLLSQKVYCGRFGFYGEAIDIILGQQGINKSIHVAFNRQLYSS